jgi:transposase-like protein
MLQVNYRKWDHTPDALRYLALEAPHPRTRERFLALYEITRGQSATQVAQSLNRHDETVHHWIHQYNERGPLALRFVRTGGRPPFALRSPKLSSNNSAKPSSNSASPP